MPETSHIVEQVRRTKVRLARGGTVGRTLVPLVEALEVWLRDGLGEVVVRARMRLRGGHRLHNPVTPRRVFPVDDGGPLPDLAIPAADQALVVSIVVPVLSNAFLTHYCLSCIVESTEMGTFEVIVVDNGSDTRTREMLARVTGVTLISNDTNRGFVEACNQGLAAARGRYVVFLNNDTAVIDGWMEALLQPFAHSQSVGAVGAKLVYPDGRLQEAGAIIWGDGHGWNYGRDGDPDAPEFNFVREVDYCSAACLMVRRPLLEQLGGFDRRYSPAYYEDADLCFRLREHGYRVLYQPLAVVVHREGSTAGNDVSTGLKRYQEVNRATFASRHAAALAAQCPRDPRLLRVARDRRRGKRILVVDHRVPHPDEDAGSVRMAALLRILLELGHPVTFLPDDLAPVEPYTADLQQLGVEVVYGPGAVGFVERHAAQFDVVILCRVHFAAKHIRPLLALPDRPSIIFDTVDLHYLREQRHAAFESDPSLAKSANRTRDVELNVMRSSDRVWVTSTLEASLLQSLGQSLPLVDVVPTIHTVRTHVPPFLPRKHILFIGGFRHVPNEDAVLYFVNDIFPRVRAELPDAKFLIVGSHMPRSILDLASEDITVLGHVPEVSPLFDACRLSVAPLRFGAGVKGKVTQSLALGLPTVATPIAAEGLDLVDGEHLAIATDPVAFARCVVDVYGNEALWNRLSESGRRHIESRLGHEAVRKSVAAILASL